MKSAIPASALSALFSPVQFLSAQKLHALSVVTNREEIRAKKDKIQMENERKLAWEKKSLHLKHRMKAKLDLKSKVGHDDWHLYTTEEECTPFAYFKGNSASKKYESDVDVGILRGCDNPYHYCIEDTSSSLGGVCAQVIGTDREVKVARKDGPMANDGVEEGEDESVIREDMKRTDSAHFKGTNKLKFMTVKEKLKAKHILEESNGVKDESPYLIGEECDLGKNPGFVDVGILNKCKQAGHVCIEDSSSSLGGLCVNIGSDKDRGVVSSRILSAQIDSTACTYNNGTAGEKCSGSQACGGLSDSFISNNIGCGSCNAYGACSGLTGKLEFFVGS